MADREKVMRGLECCIVRDPDAKRNCEECQYNHEGIITNAPCSNGLMADALALLKEQEPRVLDWGEIGAVDGAVWLEERDENEVVPGLVMQMHSAVNLDIKKDGKLHTASASCSDYGDGWRAWSARPTEEQRKVVKWDET